MRLPYFAIIILLLVLCIGVVSAEPPKCILSVKPTEGDAPLSVIITEESNDETIIRWEYTLGNGEKDTVSDKPINVYYTYEISGEYTVTVTVFNDKEEKSSDSIAVVVTGIVEPTPTPTPTPTTTPTPKPTMNETTTVKVVYEGLTPIKDSLASPSKTSSDAVILKTATESVMSKVSYPYNVTKAETQTTFKIVKYRCDEKMQVCGYWIEAWRDGKEVYTNSPIWISPPPYYYIISEIYDEKTNELTQTRKEDSKHAVELVLQWYVDRQPLGIAKVDEE